MYPHQAKAYYSNRCVWDDKTGIWVNHEYEALPTATFKWNQQDIYIKGRIRFILDTGSQLNIFSMEEARRQGVDVGNLPDISLSITGIGGSMNARSKRFRVRITSEETGESHFEEIYLVEDVKDALLSYETLQRLGHIHHKSFSRPARKKKTKSKENICLFYSQCKKTTTFNIDNIQYSCNCPRRTYHANKKEIEEKKISRKK